MCLSHDKCLSKIIPKCLCWSTHFNTVPFKYKGECGNQGVLLEMFMNTVFEGLKETHHLLAHSFILIRSLFYFTALWSEL